MSETKEIKKTSNEAKKVEKAYRRHKRYWAFSKLILPGYFKSVYGYKAKQAPDIEGPYIVLANHCANLDPWLCGMSFKKQMYFMASEHVYRYGFASKILWWTYEPIAKMKGSSDTLAVMKAIRTLRSGKNVCLFPEGNRTFNGKTGPIFEATGKLVKTSGASLVTYKFTGGYFTNPRWGYGIRKGEAHGEVVNVYTKEQLKAMSAADVTAVIRRDLEENAYERQKANPIRYKGKNRAVGMECAVCVCPKCREIDSIGTAENSVFCKKCGIKTEYSEYCFFDDDFIFKTVEDWDAWQDEFFNSLVDERMAANSTEPLFSDVAMEMKTLSVDHQEVVVGKGKLIQYLDRLDFVYGAENTTVSIKISELPDISLFNKDSLVFSDTKGTHYEVKGETLKNVRKYVHVCEYLRSKITAAKETN